MGTWRSFFSFCPVTARLLVRRGGVGGALAAFGSSSFFWRVWVCVCVWGEGGGPPLGYTVPPERTRPALGAKEGTGGARRRGRPTDAGRAFFFSSFVRRGRGGRVVEDTFFFFFLAFQRNVIVVFFLFLLKKVRREF